MTHTSIILPDLGAPRAWLSVWFADTGEMIYEGDRLVEVLIDGATFDVAAPATGRLVAKHAHADQPVCPGQILGTLDVSET